MDFIKLKDELLKGEFNFLITKGKNKFFKSIFPPIQINNLLNPIFLFSSTRSGSTWLYELLLMSERYRAVFEPLPKLEDCIKFYHTPRVVLSQHSTDKNLSNFINSLIFPGKLNKKEMKNSSINSRNIHFLTKGFILKSTRANFCIDFIYKNFSDKRIKVIYLIRNPFAVVKSKILKGKADDGNLSKKFSYDPGKLFKISDAFFSEYFEKYKAIYNKIDSKVMLETFTWCLENKWIIDAIKERPWHMVVYENIFLNFNEEYGKISNYLDIPFNKKIVKKRKNKSTTAFSGNKRSFVDSKIFNDQKNFLNDWQGFFNENDIKDILKIMRYFDIDYNSLLDISVKQFLKLPEIKVRLKY